MNKKTLAVSVLAVVVIVVASLSSAVGTISVKSNGEKEIITSPLFTVRTQRSVDKEIAKKICTNYLGKGRQLNIILPQKSMVNLYIDKAIKIFDSNPALLDNLLERIDKMPYLAKMLNNYDISKKEIKNYMKIIKTNPDTLIEEIENIQVPLDTIPQPLGLDTSNPIGCFITAIVLIPAAFVVTLIVLFFTLRIFTCLNVNNCANDILQGIFEQMIQGLTES